MGTLLKFLLLALAVLWLWHSPAVRGMRSGQTGKKPAPRPEGAPKPAGGTTDIMVACAHCGVHLPASEAVRNGQGDAFCSPAHRDQHR
jgi:uncharacterized protein